MQEKESSKVFNFIYQITQKGQDKKQFFENCRLLLAENEELRSKVVQLSEDHTSSLQQICQLQEKLEELQHIKLYQQSDLSAQMSRKDLEKFQRLQQVNEQQEKEIFELKQTIFTLEQQNSFLEKHQQRLSVKLSSLEKSQDFSVQNYQGKNTDKKIDNSIDDALKKVTGERNKFKSLYENEQQNSKNLQEKLNKLTKKTNMQQSQNLTEEKEKEIKLLKNQLQILTQQIDQQVKTCFQYLTLKNEKNQLINKHNDEIKQLQKSNEELNKQVGTHLIEINELKEMLEQTENENDRLIQSLSKARSYILAFEQAQVQAEAYITKLHKSIEKIKSQEKSSQKYQKRQTILKNYLEKRKEFYQNKINEKINRQLAKAFRLNELNTISEDDESSQSENESEQSISQKKQKNQIDMKTKKYIEELEDVIKQFESVSKNTQDIESLEIQNLREELQFKEKKIKQLSQLLQSKSQKSLSQTNENLDFPNIQLLTIDLTNCIEQTKQGFMQNHIDFTNQEELINKCCDKISEIEEVYLLESQTIQNELQQRLDFLKDGITELETQVQEQNLSIPEEKLVKQVNEYRNYQMELQRQYKDVKINMVSTNYETERKFQNFLYQKL